jgi:murein L,D-transpeptidase YcbB/YkuD
VVVGKAQVTETPEFSGVVTYMVVNPTWHIPDSIAIRDYLPKLQRDPMVLKRQNIRLLTRGGTEINPKLVDFTQYTPENFPFRIKQRPNDDNALGRVKFMFPNEHSVYMHDTPHRELFARDARAFSNGCIRLEKPVELAGILLAGQVSDPAAAFDGWVAAKKERHVDLARSIPVHIVYRTVWFDDGAVRYRADVYGRDARVFEALEAEGVTLAAAQG